MQADDSVVYERERRLKDGTVAYFSKRIDEVTGRPFYRVELTLASRFASVPFGKYAEAHKVYKRLKVFEDLRF